jgi:hypothetical protein
MIGKSWLHILNSWSTQFVDPKKLVCAIFALRWYLRDYRKYRTLSGAESTTLSELEPKLHDYTANTPFDSHYFWMSGWAIRRILSTAPSSHVDVGSHNLFVNLLSAVVPTLFIDYRPLFVSLSGLSSIAGDIIELPFKTKSVSSLSCLHVAEHIGLGRYGDTLNPKGTFLACAELKRVLAPGGNLFVAVPIGKSSVRFNAHRIFTPESVIDFFNGLNLVEFSGVHDNGLYDEKADPTAFCDNSYGCGLYWFRS